MSESIRAGELIGAILGKLKEISHNTRQTVCCTAITSAGSNISVPVGFGSVAIVQTTDGIVDITLSDGSIFQMTVVGETFVDSAPSNKSLPAYTISGTGSWKWHSIK